MKKLIIILICLFAIACTSRKAVIETKVETNTEATKADVEATHIAEGKAVHETYCGQCHALKNPAWFSASRLEFVIPDMVNKVNEKSLVIDETSKSKLLKYMLANSMK